MVVVLQSIVISKVMYALPAWGGYVSRENISRIDKMLHKARRYGFTSTLHCFEELLEQADDKLLSGTVDACRAMVHTTTTLLSRPSYTPACALTY